jgi:hypothetical protein
MSVAETLSFDKLEVSIIRPKLSSKNMDENIMKCILDEKWRNNVLSIIDKKYVVKMEIDYENQEVIHLDAGNVRERIEILFHNILEEYEMYT